MSHRRKEEHDKKPEELWKKTDIQLTSNLKLEAASISEMLAILSTFMIFRDLGANLINVKAQ
jgi:hypothetical protein